MSASKWGSQVSAQFCSSVIFLSVLIVKFKHIILTCFPLNLPWNYSWHFLFSVIIILGFTIILWWSTSFKGDTLVFFAYFAYKFWRTFKLSVLTHFTLSIPWTSLPYFIFGWLLTVNIVHLGTIFYQWHTSFKVIFQCFPHISLIKFKLCSNHPIYA